MGLIIFSFVLPSSLLMTTQYQMYTSFGWTGKLMTFIFPAILANGFKSQLFILICWSFFKQIPPVLNEAAAIDGAGHFKSFFKIALPLALPTVATLAIFTFVTTWNSFMWPLIVTNSESMRTLPVGLAIYKGSFREITLWGELLACSVICTVPVIGVFLLGKKYFISDILQGGVKE